MEEAGAGLARVWRWKDEGFDLVDSLRLKSVVDFAWWHEDQGILNRQFRILRLPALPDFVKALTTDAAAQMGMDLIVWWVSLSGLEDVDRYSGRVIVPRSLAVPW